MDISVTQLKERMDSNEKLNLIDVREPHEHEEFNIGGDNIPMGTIPGKLNDLENLKNEEVILYCRSGNRSGNIKLFLTDNGFKNVRNLEGGMLAWKEKIGK